MIGQRRTAPRFQFSLRGLLGFSALLGVVLGLTAWTRAPEIPLLAALTGLVVFAWRFTQASRAGLVLFLIGAYLLGESAIVWICRGEVLGMCHGQLGSLVLGFAIVLFVRASPPRKRAAQITCAAAALALLVLWWLIVPWIGMQVAHRESRRKYLDTVITLRGLIRELEMIHSTTGSYPKDEEHWVAIRGTTLPKTEYLDRPFHYGLYEEGETEHYWLAFTTDTLFGEDYVYDSSTPERGVFNAPW